MLRLKNLTFKYSENESATLSRVSLEFEDGEFVLVCGPTGSGKSTFLKAINGLAPHFTGGIFAGQIQIDSETFTKAMPHELAEKIGYVNQQPESAFVADIVEDEIAFGMEQLGFSEDEMRNRVENIAVSLEISHLIGSSLSELSGGEQQRVAIAAALVAGQKILLLDEPTSALDPEGAIGVLNLLKRISVELGVMVLLAEHRLERVLEFVDSVVVVHGDGSVSKGSIESQFNDYRMVPPVIELSRKLGWNPIVIDIQLARSRWNTSHRKPHVQPRLPDLDSAQQSTILSASGLSVSSGSRVALEPLDMELKTSSITSVMGSNGSGKSSLLWALQGSGARSSGQITSRLGDTKSLSAENRLGLITLVPQTASDLLFLNSLGEELAESDNFAGAPATSTSKYFEELAGRINPAIHPRDLSSGQQLALVLAMQLVKDAGIILLDEPTRGLDYATKHQLAEHLIALRQRGKAILVASHDVEFVAQISDRVMLLDEGRLIANGEA
ncbi:MAG: ABC transporter ATP-binding protein [Rhodoluna sp.]